MRTRIKFCGCTSAADAELAVACGVDAIGVIFATMSPRYVGIAAAREIARAVPAFVSLIAVFVEPQAAEVEAARAAGFFPQFSGAEPAERCEALAAGPYIKVHHVRPELPAAGSVSAFASAARDYRQATWMFDTTVGGKYGGTGVSFDWSVARELAGDRPIIVSGGLSSDNAAACITRIRPYGVDVRSGIETNGVKDRNKMRAFVRAVRGADAQA